MFGEGFGFGVGGAGGGGAAAQQVIIAILLGQSNIVGVNTADAVDTDLANVYQYGGDSAVGATYQLLVSDITPLDHDDATIKGPGPGNNILAKLKAQNPSAKIVAVPVGLGGSALASGGGTPPWQSHATPGSGGASFEFMIDQANAARTAALALWPGASITVKMFYLQGEADAVNACAGATYLAALNALIANARTRITGAGSAQVVIGSMLPQKWIIGHANYDAAYATINAQHVSAAVDGANVLYVRGPHDASANDNLHYQPAAIARSLGDYFGDALTDAAGPTMTSGAAADATVDNQLAFALTCNDSHATFHINGGADAAQFEISDRYLAPVLRWTGNGTGPAIGSYVVGVRARDGSGNYGATQTITVAVAAPAADVLTYRTGNAATAGFDFNYTFTGITTYGGVRHIVMMFKQGGSADIPVSLGGDAMTQRASILTGVTEILVYDVVPTSPGSGKSLVIGLPPGNGTIVNGPIDFEMWTCDDALTYASSQSKGYTSVSDPHQTGADLTVPSGGFGLVLVSGDQSGIAPNTGLTEVVERAGGLTRVGGYEMTATGRPSVNIGASAASIILAAAYGP